MRSVRYSARHATGTVLLLVLLVVPLILSGHTHPFGHPTAADACAMCVAVHHAPALTAPPILYVAPVGESSAVAAAPTAGPRIPCLPSRTSRAPPLHPTAVV